VILVYRYRVKSLSGLLNQGITGLHAA